MTSVGTFVRVIVLAMTVGCVVGPQGSGKSWEEKSFDKYPDETITLAHPSSSKTLPDNVFDRRDKARDQRWFSITEISSARVCVDFNAAAEHENPKNYALDDLMRDLKHGSFQLRGSDGRKSPFTVVEELPDQLLGQRRAMVPKGKSVDTGRSATVCVEELQNQYGTVVGCQRYEEQAITKTINEDVEVTLYNHHGAVRMCAKNDGIVTADAAWFGIMYGYKPNRIRVVLTGGVPTSGSWGATGGRSAIGTRQTVAVQPSTVGGPRPGPSPTVKKQPLPGEKDLEALRGGKIKVEAFKVVSPNGSTVVELSVAGKLNINGKVVGWILTDGVVRDADGHAAFVLDKTSWLHVLRDGKVVKAAKLSGNTAQFGSQVMSYRNGTFVLTGGKRTELPNRIEPATISPTLALVFALTQSTYLGMK